MNTRTGYATEKGTRAVRLNEYAAKNARERTKTYGEQVRHRHHRQLGGERIMCKFESVWCKESN